MFADKDFDGEPTRITEEEITEDGETTSTTETTPDGQEEPTPVEGDPVVVEPPTGEPRKFYYDGGQVEVVAHLVHELDPNGKQLRVVKYTDYAAESVRSITPSAHSGEGDHSFRRMATTHSGAWRPVWLGGCEAPLSTSADLSVRWRRQA